MGSPQHTGVHAASLILITKFPHLLHLKNFIVILPSYIEKVFAILITYRPIGMFIVEFLMNPILMAYALLAMAIISEVIGSTFLVKSEGFTKLLPSLAVVVLFSLAFYLLSQVIKVIPLGIAYAIWAGVGIVLTALIGYFVFRQSLDFAAMIGIALIVSGVVVINLFSNSTGH